MNSEQFLSQYNSQYQSKATHILETVSKIGQSFKVYILAEELVLEKSVIKGPKIGLCSARVTLKNSLIDASKKGCPPGHGEGRGKFNQMCAGSGGSHGGSGGFGLHTQDNTPCHYSPLRHIDFE